MAGLDRVPVVTSSAPNTSDRPPGVHGAAGARPVRAKPAQTSITREAVPRCAGVSGTWLPSMSRGWLAMSNR
ncbi:hypothetical protein [Actinoalloteichus caeruleus]|uniref:hypothetical protein n=1 Tax=Actinoalloteichus cyanogriseus TaxID=2893586 RepID=UPI0004AB5CB6|nr:hypothetical protein [Actinoalloteichus caeruleus]